MRVGLGSSAPVPALVRTVLSAQGQPQTGNGHDCFRLLLAATSRRQVHQWPPTQRVPVGPSSKAGGHAGTGVVRPAQPAAAAARPAFRAPVDNNRGRGGSGSQEQGKPGRLPRDKEITYRYVIIRQDDGSLSEPQPTGAILSRLKTHLESLVMVALPQKQRPAEEAEAGERIVARPRFPICRIVNRIAERKAEYERARELRRKKTPSKELEINWAIDTHDLEHRMSKLREFLERGLRVDLSLMRKGKGKGRRTATKEEAAALLQRVRDTVAAVPGARESKPMEGELLRTAKLVLDGPVRKADKEKEKVVAVDEKQQDNEAKEAKADP